MKKSQKNKLDPDLLDEYDFSKGVRGKYAEGTNVVLLAPDLAAIFPDSVSVNSVLRELVRITNGQAKRSD